MKPNQPSLTPLFSVPNPHVDRNLLPRLLLPFPRYVSEEEFGVVPEKLFPSLLARGSDFSHFQRFFRPLPVQLSVNDYMGLVAERGTTARDLPLFGFGGYLWPGELAPEEYRRLLGRWLGEVVAVDDAEPAVNLVSILRADVFQESYFSNFPFSYYNRTNHPFQRSAGVVKTAEPNRQRNQLPNNWLSYGSPTLHLWLEETGWNRFWEGRAPVFPPYDSSDQHNFAGKAIFTDAAGQIFPSDRVAKFLRFFSWTLLNFFGIRWGAGNHDSRAGHLEPLSFLLSLGQGWLWSHLAPVAGQAGEQCGPGPFTVRPLHRPLGPENRFWESHRSFHDLLAWCLTPGPARQALLTTPSNLLALFGLGDLAGAPNPLQPLTLVGPARFGNLADWVHWQNLAGLELEFPGLAGLKARLVIRPPLDFELLWLQEFLIPVLRQRGLLTLGRDGDGSLVFEPHPSVYGAWLHLFHYLMIRLVVNGLQKLESRGLDIFFGLENPEISLAGLELEQQSRWTWADPVFLGHWGSLCRSFERVFDRLREMGSPPGPVRPGSPG